MINEERGISRGITKWLDIPFLMLLLIIGNISIYHYITNEQNTSSFYQNEFSPAIALACNHEFANLSTENNEALQLFLTKQRQSINCENINFTVSTPLNFFQGIEQYMLVSAGVVWKFFGIGWNELLPLFLLLYTSSLLALYCIFRLGMNAIISCGLTIIIAVSSLHIPYTIQLRDYSVAPFLLWLVWIAGKLVISKPTSINLLSLCIFAGVLLGVGMGFRTDFLVLIPFFILVLLLFVKLESHTFLGKVSAISIFLLFFGIVSFPILKVIFTHGGNLAHVIILGLADPFTKNLGLNQPQTYSFIPAYRDLIAYMMSNSFAERIYGIKVLIPSSSKNYEYYSELILLQYFYHFPADFLARIYASIIQVSAIFIRQFHIKMAEPANIIMLVLPIFSISLVALYQTRVALFILFTLLYFGAYPVLQFAPRHYFYLEFIGWWFVGFLAQQLIVVVKNKDNYRWVNDIKSHVKSRGKIIVISILCLIIGAYSLLTIMRKIQTTRLTHLYNQYLNSASITITPIFDEQANKFIAELPSKINTDNTSYLNTTYLKISIKQNCPLQQILLKLHYLKEPAKEWEAPQEFKIISSQATNYLIPIYNYHNATQEIIEEVALPSYWIDSLEYSPAESACIKQISYIENLTNKPLLLTLNLSRGWQTSKLYQSTS